MHHRNRRRTKKLVGGRKLGNKCKSPDDKLRGFIEQIGKTITLKDSKSATICKAMKLKLNNEMRIQSGDEKYECYFSIKKNIDYFKKSRYNIHHGDYTRSFALIRESEFYEQRDAVERNPSNDEYIKDESSLLKDDSSNTNEKWLLIFYEIIYRYNLLKGITRIIIIIGLTKDIAKQLYNIVENHLPLVPRPQGSRKTLHYPEQDVYFADRFFAIFIKYVDEHDRISMDYNSHNKIRFEDDIRYEKYFNRFIQKSISLFETPDEYNIYAFYDYEIDLSKQIKEAFYHIFNRYEDDAWNRKDGFIFVEKVFKKISNLNRFDFSYNEYDTTDGSTSLLHKTTYDFREKARDFLSLNNGFYFYTKNDKCISTLYNFKCLNEIRDLEKEKINSINLYDKFFLNITKHSIKPEFSNSFLTDEIPAAAASLDQEYQGEDRGGRIIRKTKKNRRRRRRSLTNRILQKI